RLVVQQHRRQRGEVACTAAPVVDAGVRGGVGLRQRHRRPRMHGRIHGGQHRGLLVHAVELPDAEPGEQRDAEQCQRPAQQQVSPAGRAGTALGCENDRTAPPRPAFGHDPMSDSLKTLLIVAFLVVIVWNLGAGLYYMLVDKGTTKRTVNALTKRIALSVALILLVGLAIYMGWITPHGVGG